MVLTTDAIIAGDLAATEKFSTKSMALSSWSTSTQFADGGSLGWAADRYRNWATSCAQASRSRTVNDLQIRGSRERSNARVILVRTEILFAPSHKIVTTTDPGDSSRAVPPRRIRSLRAWTSKQSLSLASRASSTMMTQCRQSSARQQVMIVDSWDARHG